MRAVRALARLHDGAVGLDHGDVVAGALDAWPDRVLPHPHRRGRAGRRVVDSEARLVNLHQRLATRTWRPSPYRVFTVREPAVRTIAALPFEDRVVQHCLMAAMAPRIQRGLVGQTWACIPGGDDDLRLIEDLLLDHPGPFERATFWFAGDDLFAALRPRGLPIGNLTSQWWANLILSPMDHLLANHLGVRDFARYMDDVVVFDDDRARLEQVWRAYDAGLARLRLRLHPRKCAITATRDGVAFLGFRLRRTDGGVAVRIADESVERFRQRMADLQLAYSVGAVDAGTVRSHIAAWMGHAGHGHTRALCRSVLAETAFVRRGGVTEGEAEGCSQDDP